MFPIKLDHQISRRSHISFLKVDITYHLARHGSQNQFAIIVCTTGNSTTYYICYIECHLARVICLFNLVVFCSLISHLQMVSTTAPSCTPSAVGSIFSYEYASSPQP